MQRREFIGLVGGAVVASPLAVRAQQGERARRIGILEGIVEGDPEGQANLAAFVQALQQLGWRDGRNVQFDRRWGAGDANRIRKLAVELAGLAPDVILSVGPDSLPELLGATRTIPLVFVLVADPVGAGYVDSLAQPGGNVTGFLMFEYSLAGKWLELLKEVAPNVTRVAVLRDPALTAGIGQFAVIQSVAPSVGLDLRPIDVRHPAQIEQAIAAFARSANGGMIVTASASAVANRELIIALAARYGMPTVYHERGLYAAAGGLVSYGPNYRDEFRRAAGYVHRILKGEKTAALPVQAPTKYELVVNLKTAKALGLAIPDNVLARADEVIQ
jgi:putative tryptophan/tyrosine transport system substrate-binding protein